MLYECKRLKHIEDRKTLTEIKRLTFETDTSFQAMIDKYFRWTTEIEIFDINIAYRNDTCKKASKTIREKNGIKDDYIVGEKLLCNTYLKLDNGKCNVNFEYEVLKTDEDNITMRHLSTNKLICFKKGFGE